MSELCFCVATMAPKPVIPDPVGTWIINSTSLTANHLWFRRNTVEDNLGVVASYEELRRRTAAPILCYIHDDVICRELGWDLRVLEEFEDKTVGVVGFGGALCHGSDDLYKRPYRLQQLGRFGYRSNVDDAEAHGERFEGNCDVAVLDGFALVVRRELLDRVGGWPVDHFSFHCYDYWVCCVAHRHGYRVRLVGIRCYHLGGQTSTRGEYQKWVTCQGMTDVEVHAKGHEYIYQEFLDVLPWRCA